MPDPDAGNRIVGTVLLRLPAQTDGLVRLVPSETAEPQGPDDWDGVVATEFYTVQHDARRMGGMPCSITFSGTEKTFDSFRWNDRLFNPETGSFVLAGDGTASVERIAKGPLATVIRTRARYVQGDTAPASKPHAVYDWFYLHDRSAVRCSLNSRM